MFLREIRLKVTDTALCILLCPFVRLGLIIRLHLEIIDAEVSCDDEHTLSSIKQLSNNLLFVIQFN